MIYLSNHGELKIVDESDDFSNTITEDTIDLFHDRKFNEM